MSGIYVLIYKDSSPGDANDFSSSLRVKTQQESEVLSALQAYIITFKRICVGGWEATQVLCIVLHAPLTSTQIPCLIEKKMRSTFLSYLDSISLYQTVMQGKLHTQCFSVVS